MTDSMRKLLRVLQAVLLIMRLVLWLLDFGGAAEPAQPPQGVDVSRPSPGAVSPGPAIG